jgi:DNA-binding XRE family transcriptional regulator
MMFDNTNIMNEKTILSKASTPKEFGEMFRAERQALGMTQQDVARAVGCRRQTIGDLEDGKSVGLMTVFMALSAIRKSISIKSSSLELEDAASFLDEE